MYFTEIAMLVRIVEDALKCQQRSIGYKVTSLEDFIQE
jgi:hypothetical protein